MKAVIRAATVCLLFAGSGWTTAARAQEADADAAVQQVQAAFDDLSAWLAESSSGEAWHTYLKSQQLREQLARGANADKVVVREVLDQFESGEPGLSLARFSAVRQALASWLEILSIPKADEVPALVRESADDFKPVTAAELRVARVNMRQALNSLGAMLQGQNGQGWRTFLAWDAMEAQLNEPEPDVEVLQAVADKFASGHRGLELPRFRAAGTALANYVTALRIVEDDQAAQHYAEQIESLAAALEAYQKKPDGAHLERVSTAMQWLALRGQLGDWAEHVRRHFFKPNLRAELSAELVTYGFSRGERTEPTEVNDNVNGNQIRGRGTSTSTVVSKLIPHPRVAVIHNVMTGTTRLGTVTQGDNGVTVRATSVTEYSAIKQLSISPNGFRDYPATARARTDSDIQSINPGGYPYDQVRSTVYSRLPGNEQSAARRAEDRIRTKMDQTWGERVDEANGNYNSRRKPLLDRGAFPTEMRFSTLEDRMRIVAREARPGEISAASEPPAVVEGHDMFVRMHETMMNNMWAAMYAGRTMTQDEFNKEMKQLFGESDRFERDPDEVPWEMTFAPGAPMTLEFGDGTFTMTIRSTRIRSGDAPFQNHPMNMTANYKIQKTRDGYKAVREGDVAVLPPGYVIGKSGPLSAGQIGVRRQLMKLSAKLFEEEMLGEGIQLQGDWEGAGTLQLKHLQTHGDWLSLGWNLEPTTETNP